MKNIFSLIFILLISLSTTAITIQTFDEDIGDQTTVLQEDLSGVDYQITINEAEGNDIVYKANTEQTVEIINNALDINNQAIIAISQIQSFNDSWFVYQENLTSRYQYQKKSWQYYNSILYSF